MTEGPIARWSLARRRQQAARDEEFTEFVTATAHGLRRTAYLLCRDWHLAQDLTQTALARMYASWGRVRRSGNLNAYSRRVLMNAIFDQRKRRSSGEVVVAELPESAARPREATVEVHVTLMRALATLPIRDQAIVVLRYWEDHSVETVAEILDVSASVVTTQSARALTRLRALLGEEFIWT
ncbi:SigE family RNA polymerase sigma factor [Phytohabitans rumicis]|uniref:RNA polymerase sigma24 factor n=1 Tax=Phytohabitans rumicis TaxID=1076125 RepID=A0A6V8LKK0_9ACTN|nr:SigE family RNA polymerase sigma factor [Phytohabitans rumicis]GFJ95408.1 RNA polymerase sigma24 factor [Phytohabitans rumicis]